MVVTVILYLIVLISIGLKYKNNSNNEEFLLGSRNIGWFGIAASIFTLISGAEMVTLSALSFVFGPNGIYIFVGYSLGFIVLALFSKKIRERSQENLMHSIPDYMYVHYGKYAGLLTTIISLLAFFALLILQFSAGALILSELTGWTYAISALISGGVIMTYLVLAGFRSVIATDILQGVVMLILLPVVIYIIWSSNLKAEIIGANFDPMGGSIIASFILAGTFTALASADAWQRVYAAKNTAAAQKGFIVAALLFILFGAGLVIIGIQAKQLLPNIDANDAFLVGISELVPASFSSIIFLLVFSAILSTADTEIFLLSSIVSREISRWKKGYKPNLEASTKTNIKQTRSTIIIISLLGLVGSVFLSDLVTIYIYLLGLILIISPPVLIGFFLKLKGIVVSWSLSVSLATFVVLVAFGKLNADNLVLIVIPSLLITLILHSLWKQQ